MIKLQMWRKGLLWMMICAIVISGGLASVVLLRHEPSHAHAASETKTFPVLPAWRTAATEPSA